MAADLNKPVSTDLYTQILTDIRDMQAALAKMNHASTSNLPVGVVQWSDANNRFEKWNGYAWVALMPDASTSVKGLTQLSTSTTSTSTTLAATASAVKSVKDSVDNLNFTNIAGTATAGQIPNLDAAKITTGIISSNRVPSLSGLNGNVLANQIPQATETSIGGVERANSSEALLGSDTTRYMTPKTVSDVVDAKMDYVMILAAGTYQSGSFTIADGRTWADFRRVVMYSLTTGAYIMSVEVVEELMTENNFGMHVSDGTYAASLLATSSTTYNLTMHALGADIKMIIGYLK